MSDMLETAKKEDIIVELRRVREEKDQLIDRLARLQAEFDNARKREAKARSDAGFYAVQEAEKKISLKLDSFRIAMTTLQYTVTLFEDVLKEMAS